MRCGETRGDKAENAGGPRTAGPLLIEPLAARDQPMRGQVSLRR